MGECLVTWRLSGVESKEQEFLKKLPDYCQQGGATEQTRPMRVLGVAGVWSNKLIFFHALFRTF